MDQQQGRTFRNPQQPRTFPITAVLTATLLVGVAASLVAWVSLRPAAAAPLAAQAAPGGTVTTASVRQGEAEAGNAVADAVRVATGADIGIVPAGAFKLGASAPKPATGEQMASLLEPATDPVVVLNLRGAQILAALERSVSFAPQPSAGFLQVSGIRFTYDSRRDSGKRIVSATLDGKALDAVRTYKVATTRPLANGSQGYFQIWDKDQIDKGGVGKTLADALAELARVRGGYLSPSIDGRIATADK
ncbi:MAG: 5'-nucleotidase C-terminal domain-containing protein [Cytophagales bacterium]|nr:5'-nucleotidase C-terminal domain-containing protein [Armatimonadota bacterium]